MVSIISEWLQKRMPSYESIKSKLTKEQIENDKEIIATFKLNIFVFLFLCLQLYLAIYTDVIGKNLVFLTILALAINSITILFSVIFSKIFNILKYKINMAMLAISAVVLVADIFYIVINFAHNIVIKILLVFIVVISFKLIILNSIIKTAKHDWIFKCGSIFCLLTAVWEFFFGKVESSALIESIAMIIILLILLKIALNASDLYFKTLFYVLTYPEEFRKKFGYSVKEWYGKHSPQYRKEKKSLK